MFECCSCLFGKSVFLNEARDLFGGEITQWDAGRCISRCQQILHCDALLFERISNASKRFVAGRCVQSNENTVVRLDDGNQIALLDAEPSSYLDRQGDLTVLPNADEF